MLSVKKYKKLLRCKDYDEMVGVVFDLTPPEIDLLPMDEYNEKLQQIFILKKQRYTRYESLTIQGETLFYKGWKSLTYGEYLDMLNYSKEDKIEHLYAIFFRREIQQPSIFDSRKLEPYDFDIEHRARLFLGADIKYFFTIKNDMEQLDGIIQRNYKILFEEEEQIDPSQITDGRERAMFIHNQRIKQAYNQLAWEYVTHALAGEDATKYNDVYNLSLFTVLNSLKLSKSLELRNKSTSKG